MFQGDSYYPFQNAPPNSRISRATPAADKEHMGNCQNYGPFLDPYYNTGPNTGPNLGDPKRDHNFDNSPYHVLL